MSDHQAAADDVIAIDAARQARQPASPEAFTQEMQRKNDALGQLELPPLQMLEFLGARLYTGPMCVMTLHVQL